LAMLDFRGILLGAIWIYLWRIALGVFCGALVLPMLLLGLPAVPMLLLGAPAVPTALVAGGTLVPAVPVGCVPGGTGAGVAAFAFGVVIVPAPVGGAPAVPALFEGAPAVPALLLGAPAVPALLLGAPAVPALPLAAPAVPGAGTPAAPAAITSAFIPNAVTPARRVTSSLLISCSFSGKWIRYGLRGFC
jgi:hypothetical protein